MWCWPCWAPARLFAPSLQGRRALLLPAGALVYIAIPPARDFATSGLENGLVLAYLGLLWWMMVCWSQALRAYPVAQSRPALARRGVPPALARRGSPPAGRSAATRGATWAGRVVEDPPHNVVSGYFDAALAFVAGLSVLVRPELALIGGLALIMMLIAARGWRRRALIVVAGGLLPVGYEIFRMGYYALLVPGTALAKDASGVQVAAGLRLPGQLQRALSAVGARGAAAGHGRGAAHHPHPPLVDPPRGSAAVTGGWPARSRARPRWWFSSL